MKLKLTLRGLSSAGDQDVLLTADATTTVGGLAEALHAAVRGAQQVQPGSLCLRVIDPIGGASETVGPGVPLPDSGIRSGAVVELAHPTSDRADRGPVAAVLKVVSGPDAGAEFRLPSGSSDIGRSLKCDVRLSDPMVSNRHARVNVGDKVEIVDSRSSNGVVVGGSRVARVQLGNGDTALLGSSVITVTLLTAGNPVTSTSTDIPFTRSPRVLPRVVGSDIPAPEVPRPPDPPRFPVTALVAPLVMGSVLFAVNRSAMSLVFVGVSPLLMVGSWLDQRMRGRRKLRGQAAAFQAALGSLREDLTKATDDERAALLETYPAVQDCLKAVAGLEPLLWSRRPEHPEFLRLRLGTGSAPAQVSLSGVRSGGVPELYRALADLREEFTQIPGVPVVADLRLCGGLGVCGPTELLDGVSRGLVVQTVALHSPAEVVLACLASSQSQQRWDWLRWLPHTSSAHSPLTGQPLSADPGSGGVLLNELEELLHARSDGKAGSRLRGPVTSGDAAPDPIVPSVLVIVDDPMVDRARLTRIAERGPDVGVHVLWFAPNRAGLPAACRSFLEVSAGGSRVGQVRTGDLLVDVVCESVDDATATMFARRLSPVVDAGIPVEDVSDLPGLVPVVSLLDPDTVDDPDQVVVRWRQNRSLVVRDGRPPVRLSRPVELTAVVGHAGTEPFTLDLRSQGPHALVGGTTGAGKSEFLQAWVLGMAHAYGPDRVTFLFVDYKGGSAFAQCDKLPHRVGMVTDLNSHLVRRALRSLRAEIRHREELLSTKGAKDLAELEMSGDPDCPPSLIIVVDEFAALVTEVPEFVDGVVDVAQRGRSLGLHLILATQRPAGVIKDNLRANTNLRVALRMADEHDSSDVIGDSRAALFDSSLPGRGAARTGPGRIALFQAAFPGSRTPSQPPPPPIDVVQLGFGAMRRWRMPERHSDGAKDLPKDIERVVATVREAARRANVPAPRPPWLDVLDETYDLRELVAKRDPAEDGVVLGVMDDPDRQRRAEEFFRPDEEGHILYYGAGGSGKSTALRSLAVAASLDPQRSPTQVYALDFAGGALDMLKVLPTVGSVISGDDDERVARLFRHLKELIDARAAQYSASRAATLSEFRRTPGNEREPRVIVLIDGFGTFRKEYEAAVDRIATYNRLQQVLVDGRAVGVHVAMTADRPSAVPTSVASAFQRKVVLRQVDDDAYMYLGLPKDVLTPTSPPGRAMQADKHQELQLAVYGANVSVAAQARDLEELAASLGREVPSRPPAIRSLPSVVEPASLPASVGGQPVLGLADDTLAPLAMSTGGLLLVAGPAQSGRSNALRWIAESLRRAYPGIPLIHLSPRLTPLAALDLWNHRATGAEECALALKTMLKAMAEDSAAGPGMGIVVEHYPEFVGSGAESSLLEAAKLSRRHGHLLVGESETPGWSAPWPLIQEIRNGRTGLVLQPDQSDGDTLLRTSLPRVRRADLPPGRGFWIRGGRATKVQIPLVE